MGAIKRIPSKNSILSNLSQGGTAFKTNLNKSEKILSNKVAKVLIKNDIYFAGIDLVSGKLIGDINVTSPTGLPQYKELTGINVITEIMHIEKIEEISSVSDILQVGTRNMQNYPLLEALGKQKKPVMLKRHYGASLRDWLGAAEYILYNGNPNVILCERGVSVTHTHRSTSRFLLDLQVIPAARDFTHLPIISDPSHATCWADWVPSMCYASVGSGVDGVMVEVHPDPKNAATDPLQPIGFETFSDVMNKMNKIHKILQS